MVFSRRTKLLGAASQSFFMVDEKQLARWQAPYAPLRGLLAQADWISEDYVQDRGPGAGGPCYQ